MKVAVLFSPGAGGNAAFAEVGKVIQSKFADSELYAIEGAYGGMYLENCEILTKSNLKEYIANLHESIQTLVDCDVDLIVSVGGDGLATYIADYLIVRGYDIPILGIAGGTANVGPIVSYTLDEFKLLNVERCMPALLDAVEVLIDGKHVSYAFNDVVLGDTFLGMSEGEMANLSIEELLLRNTKKACIPCSQITSSEFEVRLNGTKVFRKENDENLRIAQIIVSSLQLEPHYGRAIYGPLCSAPYTGKQGVVAMSDAVIVKIGDNEEGVTRFANMRYLLFGESDEIEISGLTKGIHVVCDGNPYLLHHQKLQLRYHKGKIRALKKEACLEAKI